MQGEKLQELVGLSSEEKRKNLEKIEVLIKSLEEEYSVVKNHFSEVSCGPGVRFQEIEKGLSSIQKSFKALYEYL